MVVDTASAFVQSSFLCLRAPHCSLVGLNVAFIVVLQCLALPCSLTNACASILYGTVFCTGTVKIEKVEIKQCIVPCARTRRILHRIQTRKRVSRADAVAVYAVPYGLTDGYSYLYPYKWTRVLLN